MYDLSASKEYVKYTLTLAGVGTAWVSETLEARSSFYGWTGDAVEGATRALALTGLALFVVATLLAIACLSAMTNAANNRAFETHAGARRLHRNAARAAAGGAALPAAEAERDYGAAADQAESWSIEFARWHLLALAAGFVLVAAFYGDDIFDPPRPSGPLCAVRIPALGNAQLTYRCDSAPGKVLDEGRLRP